MNWLDKIFLPEDTLELMRLNKIYEAFNNGEVTPKEAVYKILNSRWKYHKDEVEVLLYFIYVKIKPPCQNHNQVLKKN